MPQWGWNWADGGRSIGLILAQCWYSCWGVRALQWCHMSAMVFWITVKSPVCSTAFGLTSEKTKLHITGHLRGESTGDWFPSHTACNLESVSMSWCHHGIWLILHSEGQQCQNYLISLRSAQHDTISQPNFPLYFMNKMLTTLTKGYKKLVEKNHYQFR